MVTAIVILSIILTCSILLNIRAIKNNHLWKKISDAHKKNIQTKEEIIQIQLDTIEIQKKSIDTLRQMLAKGLSTIIVTGKMGAN